MGNGEFRFTCFGNSALAAIKPQHRIGVRSVKLKSVEGKYKFYQKFMSHTQKFSHGLKLIIHYTTKWNNQAGAELCQAQT